MEIYRGRNVGPVGIPSQRQYVCIGPVIVGYQGGGCSSYLCDGWLRVVRWVTLCHQLMWQGIGYRVPREGIWSAVQDTLHPLSCEVVGHDSGFKALEVWVLNLVEPVIVEDWYEGMMIGENGKMLETSEK